MPDPKGNKLFVNLSASQVRRRLKGVGYGVRKVQTAGRNMAVIIHTAVGHNLRALKAIFADVGSADSERELPEKADSQPEGSGGPIAMQEPLIHDDSPRVPPDASRY